jgi:RNA polymerase sigma-70 factor (ECF subfamily)
MSGPDPPPLFLTTRWSLVMSAAAESDASLEALCRQYWFPAYAVARRGGHDVESAKDLTQAFFAKLLEKRWLVTADPAKGRFRTFLITALKRFMVNEWHRENAAKRGGGREMIPLDTSVAESLYAREDRRALAPDALFDRHWALALLDAAMLRLENEYREGGREEEFAELKPCLTAGRGETDYEQLARVLSRSEGAVRVAVHRLRKRYRAVFREEIARTVDNENDVEDEMRELLRALSD